MAHTKQRRDIGRTIWDGIWALDGVVFVLQVVATVFVGVWVVGRWVVQLWGQGSWWHLSLLVAGVMILLFGLFSELKNRRIGPLTVLVFGLTLVFGVRELLGGSVEPIAR
jgi:hypothetical protein